MTRNKETTKKPLRAGASGRASTRSPTAGKRGVTRGKAKTAYELLERVCEAIKAHPLNYYQGMWKSSRRRSRHYDVCLLPDELNTRDNTCGTAFCRAGWMVALHDGVRARPRSFEERANALLGTDMDDSIYCAAAELFMSDAVDGAPGTRAYVRAGIKGIREFMKTHRVHLKARSLQGV